MGSAGRVSGEPNLTTAQTGGVATDGTDATRRTTYRAAAVTGAFGFTGKYIARRLLAEGDRVVTLTNHPDRADPFDGRVEACPLDFADPAGLAHSLEGVDTLYNTYWIRFESGASTFARAVEHSKALIRAAQEAGVRRLVHVSIVHPDPASPLPYFSGKAAVEQAIRDSRLSWAILRPAVVFGREDILINNIAWPCGGSRSSPSPARANTGFNLSTRKTWPHSPCRWAEAPTT